MLRLYKENSEFKEFSKFETDTGRLIYVSKQEFIELQNESYPVFIGDSETHTFFPRRIYFQITRYCNLECDYCFIHADKSNFHLDVDVINSIAAYLGEKGLMEVRLTGGEPTLHPNFQDIYKAFRRNNVYVSIATNGVWDSETLDFLCRQKSIWLIVSIDGSEETHNMYRKNTYKTIVKNLAEFKKRNSSGRLRLNTVLTKENINELENLAKLTKELSAESITLIPLRPQVRDSEILKKMINATQFKEAIIEMCSYKKKYGINFTTTIESTFKDEIMQDVIFTKRSSCAAGREGMNLDFDSENKKLLLYACSYCPASDLNENPLIREPFLAGVIDYKDINKIDSIWNDDSRWKIFRDLGLKSEKCQSCNDFGINCTGSCPIQNINYNKIDLSDDIKKQYMEQMKNTAEWYCYKM